MLQLSGTKRSSKDAGASPSSKEGPAAQSPSKPEGEKRAERGKSILASDTAENMDKWRRSVFSIRRSKERLFSLNPEATYRSLMETSPHLLRHPQLLEAKIALEDYRRRKQYCMDVIGAGEVEAEIMSKNEKEDAQSKFDKLRDGLNDDKQVVAEVFKLYEPEEAPIDKATLEPLEKELDHERVEQVFEHFKFDVSMVEDAFDMIDTDRSGGIDVEELQMYIEMMGGIEVFALRRTKREELEARNNKAWGLLNALKDPSFRTRERALEDFGEMGEKHAFGEYFPDVFVNGCIAKFADEDWRVRSAAVEAVSHMGLRGRELGSWNVREMLRLDVDARVRSGAAVALERMFPPGAISR